MSPATRRHSRHANETARLDQGCCRLASPTAPLFDRDVLQPSPAAQRLLGKERSALVAHVFVQSGRDGHQVLQVKGEPVKVDGDSVNATVGQHVARLPQVSRAFEDPVGDDGFEGIQLRLPSLRGERHGEVVADDFERNLVWPAGREG